MHTATRDVSELIGYCVYGAEPPFLQGRQMLLGVERQRASCPTRSGAAGSSTPSSVMSSRRWCARITYYDWNAFKIKKMPQDRRRQRQISPVRDNSRRVVNMFADIVENG